MADVIITNAATIANNVRFIIQFVLRVITVFVYAAKIVLSRLRDKGKTIKRSMVFPKDMGRFFKRTPLGFQKDSFWSAKGLVLGCKRTRFGVQKDSFLNFEF